MAKKGQFPWQVILKQDKFDDLECGGSIISHYWVLTAAHCTDGLSSIYLVFGTTFLDDENAWDMIASRFYQHPDYNANTLNNDISLIKLPMYLPFTKNIHPISLVPTFMANETFLGQTAIIAGYGLMDDEYLDNSKDLLWAKVVVIENKECMAEYGDAIVIESTLCARGWNNTNQSICSGDSGGPLIIETDKGSFMQIGINSFTAEDRCTKGLPSGYLRLNSFLPFISNITSLKFDDIQSWQPQPIK